MNAAAVDAIVTFQDSGQNFDQLWGDIEPAIDETVRRRLKRRLVTGPGGADDQAAIDDCKQQVAIKLLRLPRSEGRGWFNPRHGRDRVDGLRGWLYRLASNEVESYCRLYRRHCGRSWLSLDDLEYNACPPDGGPAAPAVKSVLKTPFKIDFDQFEIRDLVARCVAALPEVDRTLYHLAFEAMLSQREIGRVLGTPAGTVCRRLKRLVRTLAAVLAAEGIDADWVAWWACRRSRHPR